MLDGIVADMVTNIGMDVENEKQRKTKNKIKTSYVFQVTVVFVYIPRI
jgi:hypothetical protein